MLRRHAVVVAASSLAACAQIIGIQELEVEERDAPVRVTPDADVPDVGIDRNIPVDAASDDADAAPTVTWKRVFVTSDTSNGILGGLAGADKRCTDAAGRAKLDGGPWVAWVSVSGKNAIDRITHEGEYRLLDGRVVVSNKKQLASGTLTSPIDLFETGTVASGTLRVWTGTFPDGTYSTKSCEGWVSSNALDFGSIGTLDQPKNGTWTRNGGPGPGFPDWGCQTIARLYCFEL